MKKEIAETQREVRDLKFEKQVSYFMNFLHNKKKKGQI